MIVAFTLILTALLYAVFRKKTPPKRTPQQKQDDELITTILPTINSDK